MGTRNRLQNGLLLAIIVLLALNLVLPVRYTLRLVKLEPITHAIGDTAAVETQPAHDKFDPPNLSEKRSQVPWHSKREPTPEHRDTADIEEKRKPVVRESKKEPEKRASVNTEDKPKVVPWVNKREPSMEKKDDVSVEDKQGHVPWQNRKQPTMAKRSSRDREVEERLRERSPLQPKLGYSMEGKKDPNKDFYKLDEIKESEDVMEERKQHRVNFHDPSQRMAYYKRLRRKLVGKGPNMLSLQEQRSKRRMELIRDMWSDWFEDDSQLAMVKLDKLKDYVTEDITPLALQSQLSQCSLALGVSQKTLQSQQGDLEKTSIKLSAFLSAMYSLVPHSFSSVYTSPCWLTDRVNVQSNLIAITSRTIGLEGRLHILPNQAAYLARQAFGGISPQRLYCLPHFFLAGFPKSATTTLADSLYKHSHVSSAIVKEAHWWTRAPIISPDSNLLRLSVLRYLMHFGQMARNTMDDIKLLSMDGSQSTLWDSNFVFNGHDFCSTPAAISHVLPDAKFIILMREPSERLYSYYLWSCSFRYGNNTNMWPSKVREDPAGNFHSEVTQIVSDFKDCMQYHSLYECSNRYTFTNSTTKVTQYCGQIGFRLVVSIYYIHIAKFMQFFPREQFLFLRMEDMSQDSVKFMNRVSDFLKISRFPPSKSRDLLERKHNRQKAGIEPMHEETRKLLRDFFRPFNRQLSQLVNDNRFLWDYP